MTLLVCKKQQQKTDQTEKAINYSKLKHTSCTLIFILIQSSWTLQSQMPPGYFVLQSSYVSIQCPCSPFLNKTFTEITISISICLAKVNDFLNLKIVLPLKITPWEILTNWIWWVSYIYLMLVMTYDVRWWKQRNALGDILMHCVRGIEPQQKPEVHRRSDSAWHLQKVAVDVFCGHHFTSWFLSIM